MVSKDLELEDPPFDEPSFLTRVNFALIKVKHILDGHKKPVYASEIPHTFADKYELAEMMTNIALSSVIQTILTLGMSVDQMRKVISWAANRSVSLQLRASETCSFARQAQRDVVPAKSKESRGCLSGMEAAWSSKILTTVTEYVWKFDANYDILAVCGVGREPADQIMVCTRSCSQEIISSIQTNPRSAATTYPNSDVDISWLLRRVNPETLRSNFRISRDSERCRTPRRNRVRAREPAGAGRVGRRRVPALLRQPVPRLAGPRP